MDMSKFGADFKKKHFFQIHKNNFSKNARKCKSFTKEKVGAQTFFLLTSVKKSLLTMNLKRQTVRTLLENCLVALPDGNLASGTSEGHVHNLEH